MKAVEKGNTLWLAQQLERRVNIGINSPEALREALIELSAAKANDDALNEQIYERKRDKNEPTRWHVSRDHASLICGIASVEYIAAQYAADHPFAFDVPLTYEKPNIEVGRIYCGGVVATLVITHREGVKPVRLWVFGERKVQ